MFGVSKVYPGKCVWCICYVFMVCVGGVCMCVWCFAFDGRLVSVFSEFVLRGWCVLFGVWCLSLCVYSVCLVCAWCVCWCMMFV